MDELAEVEEERTAWYTPGLYRRIAARRRPRAERAARLTLRERMRARGLHWSTELVVGVFVAVLVTALSTLAVVRVGDGGAGSLGIPSHGGDAGSAVTGGAGAGGAGGAGTGGAGGVSSFGGPLAEPSAPCIAAPIPGSAMRPCTH
jgi:hypothetical protein